MDHLAETVALDDLRDLKESEGIIKRWFVKGLVVGFVIFVLILIWKNPFLQFMLATIMFLLLVLAVWFVFHFSRTTKAKKEFKRVQKTVKKSPQPKQRVKPEHVFSAVKEFNHVARTDRDFEKGVSVALKMKFPSSTVVRRSPVAGRSGVTVDNVHAKVHVADDKVRLKSAVNKFEPSEEKAFILLDVGKVPDISKYVKELEDKGAKVTVIKKKKN